MPIANSMPWLPGVTLRWSSYCGTAISCFLEYPFYTLA
jgi:hypothetical protein